MCYFLSGTVHSNCHLVCFHLDRYSRQEMKSIPFNWIVLFVTLVVPSLVHSQYNDFRCKCICPSPHAVIKPNETVVKSNDDKPDRSVYIGNVHPHECNCDGVVLPQLTSDVQGKAKEFCPRCECKYESRNITTIRWVVTLIIGCIVCLVIYMGFLMLLDPLLHKGKLWFWIHYDFNLIF